MRAVSAQWATTLAQSHRISTVVTSQRPGSAAVTVPIADGSVVFDATADARRRCTITVPRYGPDGFDWMPGTDVLHPLSSYGMRLNIRTGVVHPDGTTERVNLGWYLITDVRLDQGRVVVTGSDLWRLVADFKIPPGAPAAFVPSADPLVTYALVLNRLARWGLVDADPQILPVTTEPGVILPLKSRFATPEEADRAQLMKDVGEFSARSVYVDDNATITLLPEPSVPGTPVLTLVDGVGGTIVRRAVSQARQQLYNSVTVVGTSQSTGKEVGRATARLPVGNVIGPTSPYGTVNYWWRSTEIANNTEAATKADQLLARLSRMGREEEVTCVPNPALELLDTVRVTSTDLGTFDALVVAIQVPLAASGGPMRLAVTAAV